MSRPPDKSKLCLARESKGLNQDEVAKELGVTQPTISNWERSEDPAHPHPSEWERIAKVYGVPMRTLVAHFTKGAA